MIHVFSDLEQFKEALVEAHVERAIDSLLQLDLPFFDYRDKVLIMYFPTYGTENTENLIVATKEDTFAYTAVTLTGFDKTHKQHLKKLHGESTIVILHFLKSILKNYSEQFQKIRFLMNELDMKPSIDLVEDTGRSLRRLTDRIETLVETIIVLKEREIQEFNTRMVAYDYDVLSTEARHWLERSRSHVYRIASLRSKSEMQSNRELNDTMKRLTVIMTVLSLIGIVVAVPGTIGAIFGIPALSDAYFKPHTATLVLILIAATFMSIILGFFYWKSLGLRYNR